MAFIGPLLRPMKILKDEYIFMEGDPADEGIFSQYQINDVNSIFYKKWENILCSSKIQQL